MEYDYDGPTLRERIEQPLAEAGFTEAETLQARTLYMARDNRVAELRDDFQSVLDQLRVRDPSWDKVAVDAILWFEPATHSPEGHTFALVPDWRPDLKAKIGSMEGWHRQGE